MRFKPAMKFVAYTNLAAAVLTLLAALLLKRTNPVQFADTGTIIAIIICALGGLMARGASKGAEMEGDAEARAGVNTGWLLIAAGTVWLGLISLSYYVLV